MTTVDTITRRGAGRRCRWGLLLPLALAGVLAACGSSASTRELGWSPPTSAASGWSGVEGAEDVVPQIVPESTLPPGVTTTVAVPPVLPAPDAVVAAASTRRDTPSGPPTTVASTPSPTVGANAVPGGARALERLGSEGPRSVAAQALGRIRFNWEAALPGWQVRFLPGRSGYRGSTFPDAKVIEIYVRGGDSPEGLAHVIAHEMGHALDVSRLNVAEREVWRMTRRIAPGVPWFPSVDGAADYATGAGDFAESFAHWQTGVGWYSQVGPPPNLVEIGVLSALTGVS